MHSGLVRWVFFSPSYVTSCAAARACLSAFSVKPIMARLLGTPTLLDLAARLPACDDVRPVFPADRMPVDHRAPFIGGATTPPRILLVDDEPSVRLATKRLLTRAGYDVVEAVDGQDALDQWLPDPNAFALVLSDVRMPRLDGIALVQRLRRAGGDARVMLMSGYVEEAALREVRPVRLLEKPFDGSTLLRAVRSMLDEAMPVVSSVTSAFASRL
jgi:CheY-like chemotaxis protein